MGGSPVRGGATATQNGSTYTQENHAKCEKGAEGTCIIPSDRVVMVVVWVAARATRYWSANVAGRGRGVKPIRALIHWVDATPQEWAMYFVGVVHGLVISGLFWAWVYA